MQLKPANEMQFQPWPKIPRLVNEKITITEKMDGTNACIVIEDGEIIAVQSRKRFIYPEGTDGQPKGCDNAGFAQWVEEHAEDLITLGDGHHYGEWCGPSIQRNPHNLSHKTFFLFNTARWGEHNPNTPYCCEVVPVLYSGKQDENTIPEVMDKLWTDGLNDNYRPEGVIIFNHLTQQMYKVTYENAEGKWKNDKV